MPLAHWKRPASTNGEHLPPTQPMRVNLTIINVCQEPDLSNTIEGEPKKDSTQWNYSRAPISDDVNPQSYAHAYPLILLHLNTELIIGQIVQIVKTQCLDVKQLCSIPDLPSLTMSLENSVPNQILHLLDKVALK